MKPIGNFLENLRNASQNLIPACGEQDLAKGTTRDGLSSDMASVTSNIRSFGNRPVAILPQPTRAILHNYFPPRRLE